MHKEIWTKDELKNFTKECNPEKIREKFGLKAPENQDMMEVTAKTKFEDFRQK